MLAVAQEELSQGSGQKEPESRLCSATRVIEQVCVARESWRHLRELWPLA